MDVGRTLNAFTQGTYGVIDSFYEFIENSADAGATKLGIRPLHGAKGPIEKIVVTDNGRGMTAAELEKALVFAGEIRQRASHEISEFGVGMKAAAFALAKRFVVVTRTSNGEISGAYLNLDTISQPGNFYEDSAYETPTYDYEDIWSTYAIDSKGSGTIIYLEDITQTEFSTCESLIKGLHIENRLALRYRGLIDSGAIVIYTQNGKKGQPKPIKSFDPLYRNATLTETVIDRSFCYTPKNDPANSVHFDMCVTRIDKALRGKKNFGIYVKVAGVVIDCDTTSLLGMFKKEAVHSWKWGLRAEIDFASKVEFFKVMDFTSHKHGTRLKTRAFGDWLRDSDVGRAYILEETNRKVEAETNKIKATKSALAAEDSKFITTLSQRKEVYGSSDGFRSYLGKIGSIKPSKFSNPLEVAKFTNGTILYNSGNAKLSRLLSAQNEPTERNFGRALATAHALRADLESNGACVTIDEYELFVSNMMVQI